MLHNLIIYLLGFAFNLILKMMSTVFKLMKDLIKVDEIENQSLTLCSVRRKDLHWRDAKGPTYARYLVQQLWRGEKYYLQIDRFVRTLS
jgi:hypothetical protein